MSRRARSCLLLPLLAWTASSDAGTRAKPTYPASRDPLLAVVCDRGGFTIVPVATPTAPAASLPFKLGGAIHLDPALFARRNSELKGPIDAQAR